MIQQSDIILNVGANQQRTEAWRDDRLGRWTSSQMKQLMASERAVCKFPWNSPERIYGFGKSALKYIYENAKERQTGKWLDSGAGTKDMQYGTKIEPLIFKASKRVLRKKGIVGTMETVGFKPFDNLPTAGVSSDGILRYEGKVVAALEIKACTSWGSHYDRTFDITDESSTDFWQIQAHTMAWNVDKCLYIVAEPPKSIYDYLNYDGDIMDLYKHFVAECPITIEIVKASPVHQEAIIKRIEVAEEVIELYLEDGGNLSEILYNVINKYR